MSIDGWVNVEDRLPIENVWPLVVADSEGDVFLADYWSDAKEFWPPNGNGEYWAEKYYNVTHWRLLELPAHPLA